LRRGRPLKIVISNSRVTWRGGENWSLTAAAGLSGLGHSITLICRPESELRKRAAAAGLSVVPVQLRGDFNPLAVVRLVFLFRKLRPDVIVCNVDREVRSLGIAARLSGGVPFIRRRGSDYAFKNALRYRLSYRYLVDFVLVNSLSTMNTILSGNKWIPREKMKMIYNGIETAVFFPDRESGVRVRGELGIPGDSFVAGMMGSFLPRKEHLTLIRAALQVPGLHLLLVGPSPDEEYFSIVAGEAAPISDRVHFKGSVSNTNDYYNAMNVFVMPSSNEGFGYAAAEAMCAGIPVVVSDATSLPEVVGEAGIIFPVHDHRELASVLKSLILKGTVMDSSATAGRDRIMEKFSVERMLNDLEGFLLEVSRR
jgi:glycosyltransferase involved in cell wall biosynthesis